jgi:hypothetical protein
MKWFDRARRSSHFRSGPKSRHSVVAQYLSRGAKTDIYELVGLCRAAIAVYFE